MSKRFLVILDLLCYIFAVITFMAGTSLIDAEPARAAHILVCSIGFMLIKEVVRILNESTNY